MVYSVKSLFEVNKYREGMFLGIMSLTNMVNNMDKWMNSRMSRSKAKLKVIKETILGKILHDLVSHAFFINLR